MEFIEFTKNNDVKELEQHYLIGPLMGTEKNIFGLHASMVRNSVELWANEEQRKYWLPRIDRYELTMTYGMNLIVVFLLKV